MAVMETGKVDEHGAILLPAKLRERLGMEEGALVIAEEREDGILIRPVAPRGAEEYTPERQAEFLLSSAVDAEDYALAREEVRKLGLDPDTIQHHKPAGV